MLTKQVEENLLVLDEKGKLPILSIEQKRLIIMEIIEGKSLTQIFADNEGIDKFKFGQQLMIDEQFYSTYVKAKRMDTEYKVSDMFNFIHTSDMTYGDKRLYIDTLKWYAAKVFPRLYGEKIQVEKTENKKIQFIIEKTEKPNKTIDLDSKEE